jgi:hypothetical protein
VPTHRELPHEPPAPVARTAPGGLQVALFLSGAAVVVFGVPGASAAAAVALLVFIGCAIGLGRRGS